MPPRRGNPLPASGPRPRAKIPSMWWVIGRPSRSSRGRTATGLLVARVTLFRRLVIRHATCTPAHVCGQFRVLSRQAWDIARGATAASALRAPRKRKNPKTCRTDRNSAREATLKERPDLDLKDGKPGMRPTSPEQGELVRRCFHELLRMRESPAFLQHASPRLAIATNGLASFPGRSIDVGIPAWQPCITGRWIMGTP